MIEPTSKPSRDEYYFPEREIDIRDFITQLWKQRWVVAGSVVLALIAATAVAWLSPTVYTSHSKFIARSTSNQTSPGLGGLAQLAGISLPQMGGSDPFSHLEELLRSRDFLDEFLSRKWIVGGEERSVPEIWDLRPDTTRDRWEERYRKKILDYFRHRIIHLGQQDGMKILNTNAPDPDLAQTLNTALLEKINDYLIENVKSQAKENRLFIEARIEEVKAELNESERNLMAFQNRNLNVNAPSIAMESKRLSRAVSVNEELYLQLKKQYEIARIDEKKDQPLIIVLRQPELPLDRSQPRRKRILLIGAFLGVFAGITLSFLKVVTLGILTTPIHETKSRRA